MSESGKSLPPCTRFLAEEADEQATLFALDGLPSEEATTFEEHLGEGCERCERTVAESRVAMAAAAAGTAERVVPPPGLRQRLLSAVEAPPRRAGEAEESIQAFKGWGSTTAPFYIKRGSEGDWETPAPGLQLRKLAVDTERRYVTMLVRMDPGTTYPSHHHAGAEECYVLEGDLRVGDEVLGPGDYQYAGAGSDHGPQHTEGGCLLFIVSSQDDELL